MPINQYLAIINPIINQIYTVTQINNSSIIEILPQYWRFRDYFGMTLSRSV